MTNNPTSKSLIGRLVEAIDDHAAERRAARATSVPAPGAASRAWRAILPSPGNVLFSALLVGTLLLANRAGALSAFMPASPQTSTSTIAYQGRLANVGGTPLTGVYSMAFRLYDQGVGSAPLWEETWTGPNGVRVSDGLFNVMLGSLAPIQPALIASNSSLWLGITVGVDGEMAPRVQLGTVPYAMQALTVPDASISASKIAANSIDSTKIRSGAVGSAELADGGVDSVDLKINAVTSDKIANGSIRLEDLAAGAIPAGLPVGSIISWWRPSPSTPLPSNEWMIADGSIVTDTASALYNQSLPNLTNKFVMGVAAASIGVSGGANSLDLTHQHALPAHGHNVSGSTSEVDGLWDGGHWTQAGDPRRMAVNTYVNSWYYRHNHAINLTTSSWSGNTSSAALVVDNRPSYIGLVYLIKIK